MSIANKAQLLLFRAKLESIQAKREILHEKVLRRTAKMEELLALDKESDELLAAVEHFYEAVTKD